MAKFRRKLETVEAVLWDGNLAARDAIQNMAPSMTSVAAIPAAPSGADSLFMVTPASNVRAEIGDWIVKGPDGKLVAVKPDAFAKMYEAI